MPIGGDVPSLGRFYQGQAADLLEVAPDQVRAALEQIVAYDAAGATDAAAVQVELEEPVGEVSGFVLANCATSAGSDPTFTFERAAWPAWRSGLPRHRPGAGRSRARRLRGAQ